ncbi:hypothetical protein WM41_0365 [Corynebacterium simulans]|uniref:Uncharacterized protein n=1 Tax=Corynebacterium simulans TaxID=146827 RepID=A0ABR5VBD6_9CORY|nr:hypothetical protein WM41_0365 [Corynebacterium simulans]
MRLRTLELLLCHCLSSWTLWRLHRQPRGWLMSLVLGTKTPKR